MLVDKIICVLLLIVIVRAQNAPQAPARNPRTIQTFLTSVGDLFGYDVFRRPRIVINLPAALPAGPPPAAPAPPPAPAPAPPAPAPAPAPAAPPPAPAPAPPAAPRLVTAPNLLTDSVRRQFSVNLNWDRNRSPQNEPIISAVVVSPAGVTLPAADTQIPVAAPAAPPPAPLRSPPPPPPQQRLPDYDEQSEREEDDDDRPKRFYIDIPDYGNAEEVKESKREISEDKDQSKVRFKEDFQNYWKNAPWIDERGYKYIVPQEAAASTLVKANRANDIPQELSKYEEFSLPKENKVRSLKIKHNVRVYGQDSFAAPSTAITYFQKPPQDKQTAQPSYLTSKVVNAELLEFYKQKFKNDAANQQEQQFNQPIYVKDYVEQPQNEEQLNNAEEEQVHEQPVNDYVAENAPANDDDPNSPLNFYALPGNQNKQVKFQQIIIENETPLDFYANPQLQLQDFRIEIKDEDTENVQKDDSPAEEVRIQPATSNEQQQNDEEANVQKSNADDIESIDDEKIIGSNDKENFEVEHLSDNVGDKEEHATNTDETKAEEDPQQKEEVKEADESDDQPSKAVDHEDDYNYNFNLDSFVKTHFGDRKPKTFEEVRQEIEAESEFREQQIREKEEELEKEKQLANDHENTNENEELEDENEEQSEATKEKGNEENDETKKVETQKEEEVERENTEADKNNEEEKQKQEVEASGKDETETAARDEEDEKQKITELERQHEKEFYVIFPKLGEGTEYENFFKTFEPVDESKGEAAKIKENENIDKDETNHDGEKSESTKTVKKYKQTENKKPTKNLKKDSLKDFDINKGYKKAKEDFSKILLTANKHKYPKEKAKNNVKFEPKTKFKDKNNFESTERSIVQPLYSGVWSAGNLQELYKQNKPVSIPFDHDYSASERNQKLKTRPKRETDEYLKDDPAEIQINPDEYVFDNTKIITQLSDHPAEYVPEAYSEDFTYEVPEPKFPDVKHLEKKNFKEDDTFSPNAKIISKQLARKTSYVSVDKPKTVAT